ncbi:MAG: hypothetical protein L0Y73_06255, partial [Candidatus Aminicenantes bacterium]|nr:hypothetical protein [Candidatus Aminicenantes bacterium]
FPMEYALKERIGNPDLFVGRKQELDFFLGWIDNIKKELSQSTALLARRKMGKTALMQRLFNITFAKNNGVIPFYYEIQEGQLWSLDFSANFFLTFIYQYIAFKTRDVDYLKSIPGSDFNDAIEIAKKAGLDFLCKTIEKAALAFREKDVGTLWEIARQAPHAIATQRNEFIVQMIDEFQFLNSTIYWDPSRLNLAHRLAGSYMGTAESKIAPLLVSGSWVGWLMNLLIMMLPARFRFEPLGDLPPDEAVEMVFKYSRFQEIPVSDESAYLIASVTEGSPFYISALFRSRCPGLDLTTCEGLVKALEFETLAPQGTIKNTWMEYIQTAFSKVNDRNAKRIVLYLCKNKHRELTRKEIIDDLKLDLTDRELEKRMEALIRADIVQQGQTNFDYRSVSDNIFDKVFRGVYQKEIDNFDIKEIAVEYDRSLTDHQKEYRRLQGQLNALKGYY